MIFTNTQYPNTRLRRLRSKKFIRDLVAEHNLTEHYLIFPVFVHDQKAPSQTIKTMPGIYRYNFDDLLKECELLCELKIPAIAIFPVISQDLKTNEAIEAYNPEGLIPKVIKAIKSKFPELGIISDIALDPYTSHGQDGLIDKNNKIINDATIQVLQKQALCHAQAGVDIVAPSDMMDGRIGEIRKILDKNNFIDTNILAYSAKYASNFYGPFRDAVDSLKNLGNADKKTYQLSYQNANQALHEVALDIQEGADMVMVKPGSLYLDIVNQVKQNFKIPTFVYQISGEYAMLKLAAQNNLINEQHAVLETLISMKRAGADAILTYYAKEVAKWLR